MRYWKKMVTGGAAMLISAGAVHAGQEPGAVGQADQAMTSARRETSSNANGGAPSDPARAKSAAAVNGDGADVVTHDELDKLSKELLERAERERARDVQTRPAPTFTDAG